MKRYVLIASSGQTEGWGDAVENCKSLASARRKAQYWLKLKYKVDVIDTVNNDCWEIVLKDK